MVNTLYRYYNANPFHKLVDDCFVRSICTGEGREWEEVYREMFEMAIKEGYVPGDEKLIEKYLKSKGWVKQKRPVKANGKFYTIKEFLEVSGYKEGSIINAGNCHMSYISDGYVWDIFNCEDRIMNCWWTVDDDDTNKAVAKAWSKLKEISARKEK